jgi:hypothetical protein
MLEKLNYNNCIMCLVNIVFDHHGMLSVLEYYSS